MTRYISGRQQSFEEAESKKKDAEEEEGKPDQLTQLVTTFSHKATTEHTGVLAEDPLYMTYAEIMGTWSPDFFLTRKLNCLRII